MGKSRMGIAHFFSSQKHDLHSGRTKQPLVISSPIGPVKNSRGPDLTRSDGLIIVDAINDCGPPRDDDEIGSPETTLPDKKMAISMFARKTLLKTQSLASLATPAKEVQTSARTPRSKFDDELSSAFSKVKSVSASTPTVFSDNEDHEYTHATKPPELVLSQRSKIKFATRLPKSKTMNVLQDIKNSVPRRTNIPASIPNPQTSKLVTPLKQPNMSRLVIIPSLARRSLEESASSSRHSSTTNITTPDSSGPVTSTGNVLPSPGQIIQAQCSAYWSGRFTSLRDRLSSEHMAHILSQTTDTIQTGISEKVQTNHLPYDDELCGDPPYPLRDEDDICRQAFSILECQCVTAAAQESLRRWRENYALIHRRPNLLPKRSGFFGDSQISRRFASHARHPDMQSLAFLEDAYYSNASNAFGMTNPHSLEGRYLNFR